MTDERSRVLTLVFTDLVDSTALKTERGDHAVQDLIRRHREEVLGLAEECAGRIIDWAGDGCFLTFETSSAAVMFALRLQQAHSDQPEIPEVRIGVHMGEVSESPGAQGPDGPPRIEGLAVDIAARVSGLARPGQVLMSSAVYDSARQRIGVDALGKPILWQAHGAYELKGFDKALEIGEAGLEGLSPLEAPEASEKAYPVALKAKAEEVRVEVMPPPRKGPWIPALAAIIILLGLSIAYLVSTRPESAPSTTESIPVDDVTPITSLAVLPLDNLTNDPEQDFFADGMTEAIISALAKIEGLKIISRTSALQYRGTIKTMPQIADELGVEGLITGSVLREANMVRVTVQLIKGASDSLLWSATYTNTLESVMKLQAEISLAIADAIEVEVSGDVRKRIATAEAVNPDAYDAYLIGHHHLNDVSLEGLTTAIGYFEQAIALDPEFAYGWGGLVCAYWETVANGLGVPREVYPKARAAGIRALELNPDMSGDQSHLGMISMGYDLEWESAEERFLYAMALSPSGDISRFDYSQFLAIVGRQREALSYVIMATDLNPVPTNFTLYILAKNVLLESNPQGVRKDAEDFLRKEPKFLRTLGLLSVAYKYLGMNDAAIRTAEDWTERAQRDVPSLQNLARTLADAGENARAHQILDEVTQREGYWDSAAVGFSYVSLNELDQAFAWLEKSYEARDWGALSLRTEPYRKIYIDDEDWLRFRGDPRYHDLVERMNFPPFPAEHPGYADDQAWTEQNAAAEAENAPIEGSGRMIRLTRN